jgi:magnesium chelatase family protein
MDRIDLQVEVPPVTPADLALPPPAEGTAEAAARVAAARAMQVERGEAGDGVETLNARLQGQTLERVTALDQAGKALLAQAAEAHGLSARGWTRTLRLARTIADLDGVDAVRRTHVAEALIYRRPSLVAERPTALLTTTGI